MTRRLFLAAGLSISCLLGLRADYTSIPLAQSRTQQEPYSYVGIVLNSTGSIRGSGTVVADPKIVLACAHLPFVKGSLTWSSDNQWFRAWESSTSPTRAQGQALRGYWKFANYSDLVAEDGTSYPDTFAVDFVAFYAYENLGPGSAGFWYDGQRAIVSSAAKSIVGYPVGLYPSDSPSGNLIHQAGPFTLPFTQMCDSYSEIQTVSTGPGNSGGPVFVTNESALTSADQGLRFAAVLVSGLEKSLGATVNESGVVAVTAPEWDLVNGALNTAGEPPINDNWASALQLSGAVVTSVANNTLATKEAGEPNHTGNVGGHSVWWRWVAAGNGPVAVSTSGSNFDTLLSIYTGPNVGALAVVAADDDSGGKGTSTLSFNAVAQTEYWIAVDGKSGATGDVTLNLTFTPPAPANDAFANATALSGLDAQAIGHNINATKEPGEPNHAGDTGGSSVWWKWVAPADGQAFVTTAGSKFDTLLAVYTGTKVNGLSLAASNDNPAGTVNESSTLTFAAKGGTTYWIAVDGFKGQSGVINLSVALTPPVPLIASQPVSQAVAVGAGASLSVVARGDAPLNYQWQRLASGSAVWENLDEGGDYHGVTTAALGIATTASAMSGDQFRCVVTSTAGMAVSGAAALTISGTATVALQYPAAITGDSAGNLYVADTFTNTIQKITPAGVVTTLAGASNVVGSQDGNGTAARFNQPSGVAIDGSGNLYVADTGNGTVRRIAADGNVTTIAGSPVSRGSQDGTGANALFSSPAGVAVDGAGNLFVTDALNATVRIISPAGVVSTVAGIAAIRGDADGSGSAARFNLPNGVAADAAGNIYVADTYNDTIRKITLTGTVTTLAGSPGISGSADLTGNNALFNQPYGVGAGPAGTLFIADTGNGTIRKISPDGSVTTFAGVSGIAGLGDGAGSNALFNQPHSVWIDSAGNIFVADTGNGAIRKITPNGTVTTMFLTVASAGTTNNTPMSGPNTAAASSGGGVGGGGGGAMPGWFVVIVVMLGVARWTRGKRPR